MLPSINYDNISIVLIYPRFPENIGASARAMHNMGFENLVVVHPENYNLEKIYPMATHAAKHIVDQARVYGNLESALENFQFIVGTTARMGKQRRQIQTSAVQLGEIIAEISQSNQIAILFGPENKGLSNDVVRFCNILATIPTEDFASLNLAQAVLVICYELHKFCQAGIQQAYFPRLATHIELENMYNDLKGILIKISFIQADSPDYWMTQIRLFLNRFHLRSKDVRIIRGLCRQINWYGNHCFDQGIQSKGK